MSKRHNSRLAIVLLGLAVNTFAASKALVVSSTSKEATHSTIQAAVNACTPQDTCTIKLVDPEYALERPVWIVGKANIAIEGVAKSGIKPIVTYERSLTSLVLNPLTGKNVQTKVRKVFILPYQVEANGLPCEDSASRCTTEPTRPYGWGMWPYKAISATASTSTPSNSPGDQADTSDIYSTIGYQRNGMFVIESSQDIAFHGLVLDGVRPMYFVNNSVWNGHYDVVSGTSGLNIIKSLRVSAHDCEIKSFFAAIRILGDSVKKIRPVASSPSSTGGHIFERNLIHDNWWAFYDAEERDLGSVIRFNVAWNNINKSWQYPDSLSDVPTASTVASDEMNNQTGGFMYSVDTVYAVHKIHNNTLHKHGIVFGYDGWGKREFKHLFYDNVLTGPVDTMPVPGTYPIKFTGDWHQVLQYGGTTVYNNTFELGDAVKYGQQTIVQSQIYSDTLPDQMAPGRFCTAGCWVTIDPVKVVAQLQPQFLWNGWAIQQGGTYRAYLSDKEGKRWGPFTIRNANMYDSIGLIIRMGPILSDTVKWKAQQNMFAFRLPLQSRDPSAIGYLVPDWTAKEVTKTVRHNGWLQDSSQVAVDRGAYCWDDALQKTVLGECNPVPAGVLRPASSGAKASATSGPHSALGKWDPKGRPSTRFIGLPR